MNLINVFTKSLLSAALVLGSFAAHAEDQAQIPAPAPLTEAQMLGFLATVNAVQIDMGNLAIERTTMKRAQNFSNKMVVVHTENEQLIAAGERSTGSSRAWSDASFDFSNYSAEIMDELAAQEGAAFDVQYIDAQVVIHHVLLMKLDNEFIPNAQNPELLAALKDFRKDVKYNLDYARSIQRDLNQCNSEE